uniref:topoisomerase II n=1 Tax=Candidatus Electrothrix sp. TaxID=2170559 RepID=UPI0040577061
MISSEKEIEGRDKDLSARMNSMRNEALRRFSEINGPSSIHQMHAHIGCYNNTFVDSVRMQFQSPDDFIARWLNGLKNKILEDQDRNQSCYLSRHMLLDMYQDQFLKKYIYLFLERNFYRNFRARMRAKPDEGLWQLWFGSNPLIWGLFISPALRIGEWTNDKSQMRRESYHYWTIGHVLASGLVVPEKEEPMRFQNVDSFLDFYETVLARTSKSNFEKIFSTKYLEFVRKADSPQDIPLLIPELRYAGKNTNHRYRLDFCVLNPYTMKMMGFEVSPASSHISVQGIRSGKTQKKMNEELAAKWAKEAEKRNLYFRDFGIYVITFADPDLEDTDTCFTSIQSALVERPESQISLHGAEQALDNMLNDIEFQPTTS